MIESTIEIHLIAYEIFQGYGHMILRLIDYLTSITIQNEIEESNLTRTKASS